MVISCCLIYYTLSISRQKILLLSTWYLYDIHIFLSMCVFIYMYRNQWTLEPISTQHSKSRPLQAQARTTQLRHFCAFSSQWQMLTDTCLKMWGSPKVGCLGRTCNWGLSPHVLACLLPSKQQDISNLVRYHGQRAQQVIKWFTCMLRSC